MANEENIKGHRFTSENQPARRGKKKGSRNRATVLKKWLGVKVDVKRPDTDETQKGTVEDDIALALITKARQGDVAAVREVLDSVYGKSKQPLEHSLDLSSLDDDEVLILASILEKLNP